MDIVWKSYFKEMSFAIIKNLLLLFMDERGRERKREKKTRIAKQTISQLLSLLNVEFLLRNNPRNNRNIVFFSIQLEFSIVSRKNDIIIIVISLDNALPSVNRIGGSGMSGSNGESSICDWNREHQYHLKENQIGANNVPKILYTLYRVLPSFSSFAKKYISIEKGKAINGLIIRTNGKEIGN